MKTFVVSEFLNGNFYVRAVCNTQERAKATQDAIAVTHNRVYIEEFEMDTSEVKVDKYWCIYLTSRGEVYKLSQVDRALVDSVGCLRSHNRFRAYVKTTTIGAAIDAARDLQKKFKEQEAI